MADDIVTYTRTHHHHRLGAGVCLMCEAADEIERLRAERDDWQREFHTANSELGLAVDEIERLRAAGRALHAWITVNATFIQQERLSHDKVLNGWEEACRG